MAAAAVTNDNRPEYTFSETLDDSGNTTSWLACENFQNHTIAFTNPAQTSLTVKVEGSLDGTNFFGIDPSGNNTNPDASGNIVYSTAGATYAITVAKTPMKYIRLALVAHSGGTTAAGITPILYRGG